MKMKYDLEMDNKSIDNFFKRIINQLYKLLPMREQGKDWEKPLETLIEQLCGMKRLMIHYQDNLFLTIICKMEGLFNLTDDTKDMSLYRRTIFECLSLLNNLNKNVIKS